MRMSLCGGWEFTESWDEGFMRGGGEASPVRLPHTCKELPLHYAGSEDYQMLCGYRRKLELPEGAEGKRVFLQFDGAGHIATVYVNGKEAGSHRCGYTGFRVEITDMLERDGGDLVSVKLDTTENPTVPPFGYVIDYLTYGGLYREAWLDIRSESFIDDIYVTTPSLNTAEVKVQVDGPREGRKLSLSILDREGETLWWGNDDAGSGTFHAGVPEALPWDGAHPELYTCLAVLTGPGGEELDRQEVKFGFRTAEFRADGFYLNGKKTFLRGLNRHQCFPYVGYAAPESLQREDARILKEELGCNAVRTSHYPQSQYFLDECDRRGLLVFTEIPGWQHIGDWDWKEQACENVREMVLQNRNHPSIILWGVRINESLDDDLFYKRTNAIAHKLDPSRATSGVRYLEKSSLLEDVYAYNDFSHNGQTYGAKPKKAVTTDMEKALLISECNGHMYPTKPGDSWAHRQEHALRHIRVQDAALAEHAGCFGWCMFDYATHKDFGSGDRICYHGVMDAFRNPKLAAAAFASQADGETVLEVGSSMDIGDYPAGQIGDIYVFSNAEEVALYKNDKFVTLLRRSQWNSLPHPPFVADDLIGELLESQEGFPAEKARLIRECLNAAKKYGVNTLPPKYKAKLLYCMGRFHIKYAQAYELYGKYVANWGGEATRWRFEARNGGKAAASVTRCPSADLRLEVRASSTTLTEGDSYDMAAVRIRVLDGNGNLAPYAILPVHFELSGDAELVGPDTAVAEGGMCGTYIRTLGRAGSASLRISTAQTEDVELKFEIGRN